MREEQVFSVQGDAELIARAGHLFASVQTEFVCAARDLLTWSQPEARAAVRSKMKGDFTSLKLLSPVVLAEEAARDHLNLVQSMGAQVRISSSMLPHETIILDRRVMILAGKETPGKDREYTVTSSPTLVDGVHSLFNAIWESAVDPATYLNSEAPHLDSDGRAILDALGSGLTDQSAARRLGVSLRTYRRRVAELMTSLEAGSRFQAGLRAGELGLPR